MTVSEPTGKRSYDLVVFSPAARAVWVALILMTVTAEVVPLTNVRPLTFYAFRALKGLLFVAVGLSTPLALWRFDSLARGLVFAAGSAALVECLQVFLPTHSFSIFELGLKMLLILLGLVFSLNALYERHVKFLGININLRSDHLPPRS